VLKHVFLSNGKAQPTDAKLVKDMLAMFTQLQVMSKLPAVTAAEGRPQVHGSQQVLTIKYQLTGLLQQQQAAAAAAAGGADKHQPITDNSDLPVYALSLNGGGNQLIAPVSQDMAAFAVRISWPKQQYQGYGTTMAGLLATALMMRQLAAGGAGAAQPDWGELGLAGVIAAVHAPRNAGSITSSMFAAEFGVKTGLT
jgi:hypothetical protein